MGVAALCAIAGPALAQPTVAPRYLGGIPWAAQPDPQAMRADYPPAMVKAKAAGSSVLECRVGPPPGALEDCRVLFETPKALGVADASLRIASAYRVKPVDAAGAATAGAHVVVPIVMALPDAEILPRLPDYVAGQPSRVVSFEPGGVVVSELPCPTGAEPNRQCFFHDLDWAQAPDFAASAAFVTRFGRRQGMLQVNCVIGAEGTMGDCAPSFPLAPAEATALTDYLRLFRAPEKTADGVAARDALVALSFNFSELSAVIQASSIGRP